MNSGPLFLGVDVGTTAAKAVVTDEAGAILGQLYTDLPDASPRWPSAGEHRWRVSARMRVDDADANCRHPRTMSL